MLNKKHQAFRAVPLGIFLLSLLVSMAAVGKPPHQVGTWPAGNPRAAAQAAAKASAGNLPQAMPAAIPMPFIENRGQIDQHVAYYAPIAAGTAYVTRDGELVYKLRGARQEQGGAAQATDLEAPGGWRLTETLVGAQVTPRGTQPKQARISHFRGNDPQQWQTDLPTYGTIDLGEIYQGIGASLVSHDSTVEKIFHVSPGASPERIRMRLAGHEGLEISAGGALSVATGVGAIEFSRPIAWQDLERGRREVDVEWRILDDGEYGFQVAHYDPAHTLHIDPVIQATYLGGSSTDMGICARYDEGTGDILVAGRTKSVDFPGTAGGAQPAAGVVAVDNSEDVFIARLSGDLTTLIQATYLGGSKHDGADCLNIVETATAIYISGNTNSEDFPGTAGGAQAVFGGIGQWVHGDAFIAMLSPDLKTLLQATYYGGSDTDLTSGLIFGPDNRLYLSGDTWSTDLPGTAGGAQSAHGGDRDAFIASFSSDLTTLHQATYYGGSGHDYGRIVFDIDETPIGTATGIHLVGVTDSDDLPGTAGGFQPAYGGSSVPSGGGGGDGFVSLISHDLKTVIQASYLGGSGDEVIINMAVESPGMLGIMALTTSSDMPGTGGGAQPAYGGTGDFGFGDCYLALVNADLTTLQQATYLGGSGADVCMAGRISGDSVYISGVTSSPDFPGTAGGAQPDYAGGGDVFVSRLSRDLKALQQSTYVGGSGMEDGYAALRSNGDVYVIGVTDSLDLPGTTGGIQPVFGGKADAQSNGGDVLLARLSPDLKTLHQATYYGGSGDENFSTFIHRPNGDLVEANGGFYFLGSTSSSPDLPGVSGGAQEHNAGGESGGGDFFGDVFIVLVGLDLLGGSGAPVDETPDSGDPAKSGGSGGGCTIKQGTAGHLPLDWILLVGFLVMLRQATAGTRSA